MSIVKPLKNKEILAEVPYDEDNNGIQECFYKRDIVAAVAWLKERIEKNVLCIEDQLKSDDYPFTPSCAIAINKFVDEAFLDVTKK